MLQAEYQLDHFVQFHMVSTSGADCNSFQRISVPDVMWDLMSQFSHRVIFCLSCDQPEVKENLHPIGRIDECKTYEQPWLLYGFRNDVH